jgi:hypothetical protein
VKWEHPCKIGVSNHQMSGKNQNSACKPVLKPTPGYTNFYRWPSLGVAPTWPPLDDDKLVDFFTDTGRTVNNIQILLEC